MLSADLVHRQIALLAGGELFERRVVPFRETVAMALDDRITESVSKVALLAAALTRSATGPDFPRISPRVISIVAAVMLGSFS